MIFLADATATAANQLLAAQALDAWTTREVIVSGGFERNPLAQPFVHSNAGIAVLFLAENVAFRLLFRHSPKTLRFITSTESAAVVNNTRAWIELSR